jgi:putative membrane-bound dehydrogenase-like protein
MFSRFIVAGSLALFVAQAAEPDITADQMPRVPATEPEQAPGTFLFRPGFTAQLVAAEPLIGSPVALDVDEQGRAYVVEMRDYSERRPEQLGRIKRLEDTDGDGRYDKATVFLANLPWPTAITCWNGGVFIGSTPDVLYAKDNDGDGVADVRETIFTGFASDYAPYATNKLNVQALLNSFHWGVDQRIHGATSMSGGKVRRVDSDFTRDWVADDVRRRTTAAVATNPPPHVGGYLELRGRDFSFDPRTLELRAEPGGGQHGMAFDNTGRKFVCSNSDHLQLVAFNELGASSNPFHEFPAGRHSIAADGPAAEVFRRSPDEPWRVLRTRWRVTGVVEGMIEGGGRASGYFTGATGVTIYRGDAYGEDFAGDAFIADCGSNLLHRKKLRRGSDGILLIGERAADERKSEFLASTDNWFRPVQFFNAPDGCLWVLDMYRETIEHPWSIPLNLKKHLDLDSGRERGRLWRIAPKGFGVQGSRFKIQGSDPAALVRLLAHPNAWHRDTAGRLLVERADAGSRPLLRALVRESANPLGRLHALRVLAALGDLDDSQLVAALGDRDATVRRHAIQLTAQRSADGQARVNTPVVRDAVSKLAATETDPLNQLELTFPLAQLPVAEKVPPLAQLLRSPHARVIATAVHAGYGAEPLLWTAVTMRKPELPVAALAELAGVLGRRGGRAEVALVAGSLRAWTGKPGLNAIADAFARGLARGGHSLANLDSADATLLAASWQRATNRPAPVKTFSPGALDTNRLAVIASFLPALDLKGDGQRGAAIFRERCVTCHALRGEGTALGPDLASAAANGGDKLLVSIFDPNREVAPNFTAWTVETKEGETTTGLLTRETDSAVTLKLAGGTEAVFPRAQIKVLRQESRSLMPEGLESGLNPSDVAGLLAWLSGGPNPTPP